jgi:hypothetical protein
MNAHSALFAESGEETSDLPVARKTEVFYNLSTQDSGSFPKENRLQKGGRAEEK